MKKNIFVIKTVEVKEPVGLNGNKKVKSIDKIKIKDCLSLTFLKFLNNGFIRVVKNRARNKTNPINPVSAKISK